MRVSRGWLASLLLLPTAACSDGDPPAQVDPTPTAVAQRAAPPAGADETLRDAALQVMERREEALAQGDREAFLATVDPDNLGFSATQARWFDNLAKLPVGEVSYELGDASVMKGVTGEGDLQLPVDFTMELEGFDTRPVTQQTVWTFVRDGDDVLLTDDRVAKVEERSGWTPAPWDLVHIDVRRSGGILGVFDDETIDHADYVMSDLADAIAAVRPHFPSWDGTVVVYASSDVSAMDTMSAMTVDNTGGVAFPVLSRPGGPVAAYRFLVNPTVTRDVITRSHLFRHELTHVALGTTDDRSPVWLAEGVAEYVAGSVYSVEQRKAVANYSLALVTPRTLDPTQSFYTRDANLNYALAGLVCDYLATTRGEAVLWDLMRTFRTARISTASDVEDVVRRELGVSTEELSAQALAWARAA